MRKLISRLSDLRPGLRLVSSRGLLEEGPFEQVDRLLLDMSWKRRSPLYVYRLTGSE
ncbi:MAG: hypothetical protein ACPG4T_04830 [Nannocystaceae bacterium]